MQSMGELMKSRNIQLDGGFDPISRGGFTQVPNFILKEPKLSIGAKITYAMFLSYAWNNEGCFPGQDKLAEDLALSRPRVTDFVAELKEAGYLTIHRLGQGLTNEYIIHYQVRSKFVQRNNATSQTQSVRAIKEQNIHLDASFDPVSRGGFTQVPNFILKEPNLSIGAKLTYAMFLSYAWHDDGCFPGQDILAGNLGLSRSRSTTFVTELKNTALVTVERRGQGLTNNYVIHYQVRSQFVRRNKGIFQAEVSRQTSRSQPADN
jgi:hypothetical protein